MKQLNASSWLLNHVDSDAAGRPLRPAVVDSPYIIRVAIALLMVAASIPGRSVIRHAAPIRRAHPRFVENLCSLGAQVAWVEDD